MIFLLWCAIAFTWNADAAAPRAPLYERSFTVDSPGAEGVALIHASCARCDWGIERREAVAVRVLIDGTYSQHLLLYRGVEDSEYRITLGTLTAGEHSFRLEADPALSAKDAGPAVISRVEFAMNSMTEDRVLQAFAPILYARPDTVGRFTDLPVLMWSETFPTPRGKEIRYSVIFTNEDGGTATDRLMATWGRTTDIEYVYGAELDNQGNVIAEEFQGPGHELPPFRGRHVARHPFLWVSTDNNMVSESGSTAIRYAPAPIPFDLTNMSREEVMDRNPWTYTLAAKEMVREGKVVESAVAGSGQIPDPRRFVHIEACTELTNAAVAFSIRATDRGHAKWFDSDRGLPAFRIVRSGCFRGAVPLPTDAGRPEAVRFRAYVLPPKEGEPAVPPGLVRLLRVNKVFTVDEQYQPLPSLFSWTGSVPLAVDGDWREFVF